MSGKHTSRITPFVFAVRFAMVAVATLLIPPFILLAVAPMLLFASPIALIAIPFVLSAFAGEAREVPVSMPRRLPALRHVVS